MVKYVRRDIKTLTDADRNKFLDTMSIIYKTKKLSDAEGKYGSAFKPISDYVLMHIMAGSDKTCDHYHDVRNSFHQMTGLSHSDHRAMEFL
jgi:hypothetical protein